MIKKWETLGENPIAQTPIFSLSRVSRRSPTSRREGDFFVVKLPSWVNIFACTSEGNMVAIHQYRHGTDEVTLEIPGGGINPDESPLQAAQRELQEETGYTSQNWQFAGTLDVNPAIQNNFCHIFVALNATKTHPTNFDEHEEIEVAEIPLQQFKNLIRTGKIRHSLVIAGAYFAEPILESRPIP